MAQRGAGRPELAFPELLAILTPERLDARLESPIISYIPHSLAILVLETLPALQSILPGGVGIFRTALREVAVRLAV